MGLGSTAKKLQGLSDRAEAMYRQVQELQERIFDLEEEVDDTHETVKKLDHNISEQRALLLEIAKANGIDGEQVLAQAAIDEAEREETADTPEAAETNDEKSADADPARTQ